MGNATLCNYTHTYIDMRTGISHDYQCPRLRHDGGQSCIFHSAAARADPDRIGQAFLAELQSEIANGTRNPILFIGCRIPSIAVVDMRIDRTVCFADAKFMGDIEFVDVSCGAVDFTDAVFAGQLRMTATTAGMLSLRKARFKAKCGKPAIAARTKPMVDIGRCKFESFDMALMYTASAHLEDCELGEANFRRSSINDLLIRGCELSGAADFVACEFDHAQFQTVTFGGAAALDDINFRQAGRFVHSHFRQQELVRFGRDLSNVSLLNTDVTRIRFGADTIWNSGDGDPYAILDEREIAAEQHAPSPSEVLAVYRNLRECHEYWLMYGEAGKFYIKEMDLRRRYKTDGGSSGIERHCLRRYVSLTNGYNVLCRYGESLGRASAWVAGVFAASTTYYFLTLDLGAPGTQSDRCLQLVAALEHTLAAFLHAGSGGVDDYLVRVASLPTLGSLFIVLKRRLERKLRH